MSGNFKSRAVMPGHYLLALCFTAGLCLNPLTAIAEMNKFAVFNAQLSAPPKLANAELKKAVGNYIESLDSGKITPVDVIMDRNLHAAWVDLWWQVERAMEGQQLYDELADYGIVPDGDGTYSIDLDQYPHWLPLDKAMALLFPPEVLDWSLSRLQVAGFRDNDIATLRKYLADHPYPLDTTLASHRSLTKSFVTRLKQQRVESAQRADPTELMAFQYQVRRTRREATRTWMADLLQSLDAERRAILVTKLMDWRGGGMGIAPDKDPQTALQDLEESLLSGPFGQNTAGEDQP